MLGRDRMLNRHPQLLTAVRKSLAAVADCLSELEAEDAAMYLSTVREELKDLLECDPSSLAWGQVVSQLPGPSLNKLDRLKLVPEPETSNVDHKP